MCLKCSRRSQYFQCPARIPSARGYTAQVCFVSSLALHGHDVRDPSRVRFVPRRGRDVSSLPSIRGFAGGGSGCAPAGRRPACAAGCLQSTRAMPSKSAFPTSAHPPLPIHTSVKTNGNSFTPPHPPSHSSSPTLLPSVWLPKIIRGSRGGKHTMLFASPVHCSRLRCPRSLGSRYGATRKASLAGVAVAGTHNLASEPYSKTGRPYTTSASDM